MFISLVKINVHSGRVYSKDHSQSYSKVMVKVLYKSMIVELDLAFTMIL